MDGMGAKEALRLDAGFWRGRRVFVTGHTGFLGSWLSLRLAHAGARVLGYALKPPTHPAMFDAVGLGCRVGSIIADIRDHERLHAAITEFAPEVAFHLAAQPLVRLAHSAPLETFSTNVLGTANFTQALRGLDSLRAAVIVTTDKVYENRDAAKSFTEADRLGGFEPYGGSKACAEIVVESFRHAYFAGERAPGIVTVRAGNIFGGGDWAADRLVPDAVRAFGARKPLLVRNPGAIRPWQHVLEPMHAMLGLAERLVDAPAKWSGAWNFGPERAKPVNAVVDELTRLWGNGACWHRANGQVNAPREAPVLMLDCGKAAKLMGVKARWTLERALAATVEWYRAHLAGADMRALTLDQITAFEGAN
jgi:CDP-glucose 4,6-dehydratase